MIIWPRRVSRSKEYAYRVICQYHERDFPGWRESMPGCEVLVATICEGQGLSAATATGLRT